MFMGLILLSSGSHALLYGFSFFNERIYYGQQLISNLKNE